MRERDGKAEEADAQNRAQPRFPAWKFHLWIQCGINRKQKQPGDSLKHTLHHLLADDYTNQDEIFRKAFDVLRAGIGQRAFPGASVAVAYRGRRIAWKGLGRFTYASSSPEVTPLTIYDLASLTKVIATTAMCMRLHDQGQFHLEQKVVEVLPEFAGSDPRRDQVTFRMLLAHSSGLPAYVKLFETSKDREELLAQVFQIPLVADPGARAEYSDIGFILLGVALERMSKEPLNAFCKREIFSSFRASFFMGFNPAKKPYHGLIPPTENDTAFRHQIVRGRVHDENAWVMGGVAGHAGCFAATDELVTFGQCLLGGGSPLFDTHTVEIFTRREVSPQGTSRALGWDTPSHPSQSGRYFSPASYGHLGYTGTSLWNDPERQLSVTLLTNRTWPDRSSQAIKQIRPAFHDAVIEALS